MLILDLFFFSSELQPTLPKGQEDDRFDGQELEHRFKGPQKVTGGRVEEEESIQGQTHRDVVDDRNVEVASIHTTGRQRFEKKYSKFVHSSVYGIKHLTGTILDHNHHYHI